MEENKFTSDEKMVLLCIVLPSVFMLVCNLLVVLYVS